MNYKKLIISALIFIAITSGLTLWLKNKELSSSNSNKQADQSFFPVGEERPSTVTSGPSPNQTATSTASSTEPRLSDKSGRFSRLTTKPVGGLAIVGQATSSALIYADRASGHLFRLANTTAGAERVSNTTIPKIYRLLGAQTGTSTRIIFQYPKDGNLVTFSGKLDLSEASLGEGFLENQSTLTPVSGITLSPNIADIAVSPKQNQLATLELVGNETVVSVMNPDGSKKETLLRSPYQEWRLHWATSTHLALTTRSARDVTGGLWLFQLKNKSWERVMAGVPGLTALISPKLDKVIYSGTGQNGLTFGFYDRQKDFFGTLDIQTWADKCVWTRGSVIAYCAVPSSLPSSYSYPDDWYRGEVSLADNLWRLNATTNRAEIIFSPSAAKLGVEIDASNLTLSSDEKTLFLINRRDGTLWSLSLDSGF